VIALSQHNSPSSRRSFVGKVPALVGSAATMGWFVNFDAHEEACQCSQCAHGANCPCNSCAPSFRPKSAAAYERDVGGASPSAVTAAYNIQVRKKCCQEIVLNEYFLKAPFPRHVKPTLVWREMVSNWTQRRKKLLD
jgi:hypothetical protein